MKKDTSIIPKGPYCYDENGLCPYWDSHNIPHYSDMENGYCKYLEKGDWEINTEKRWTSPNHEEPVSANQIGLPLSLLWDQVKECGINDDEPED